MKVVRPRLKQLQVRAPVGRAWWWVFGTGMMQHHWCSTTGVALNLPGVGGCNSRRRQVKVDYCWTPVLQEQLEAAQQQVQQLQDEGEQLRQEQAAVHALHEVRFPGAAPAWPGCCVLAILALLSHSAIIPPLVLLLLAGAAEQPAGPAGRGAGGAGPTAPAPGQGERLLVCPQTCKQPDSARNAGHGWWCCSKRPFCWTAAGLFCSQSGLAWRAFLHAELASCALCGCTCRLRWMR